MLKNNLDFVLEKEGISVLQFADTLNVKPKTIKNICQHGKIGARMMKKIEVQLSNMSNSTYSKHLLFPKHYHKITIIENGDLIFTQNRVMQ